MTKILRTIEAQSATAVLKQLRPGVFSLTDSNTRRARFGNKEEIEADVQHFEKHGVLPHSKGGWQ